MMVVMVKSGGTWLNSGYNLKVNLTRVIDECDMGCGKKINDDSAVHCLSSLKLPPKEMGANCSKKKKQTNRWQGKIGSSGLDEGSLKCPRDRLVKI